MISRQVSIMLAGYRAADFNDPSIAYAQFGAVLENYSDATIAYVTSPLTGVQSRCKFLPTIADLKEACEAVKEKDNVRYKSSRAVEETLARRKPDINYPAPKTGPGRCANLFVGKGMPRYEEMAERANGADPKHFRWDYERGGLWVSLVWWQDQPPESVGAMAGKLGDRYEPGAFDDWELERRRSEGSV
jgi:hypothetical protein